MDAAGEGWLPQMLALVALMEADTLRGTPLDARMLRQAVALLPAGPGARAMLEQLALLANRSGDAQAQALVRARLAPAPVPAALETDLLQELADKPIAEAVRVLFVVGAHRYQERPLLERVFPHLERVVLFEPHPQLFRLLERQLAGDQTTTVLPYAIANFCGTAPFHVTEDDAASSSLLEMKQHRELFPHVHEAATIAVQVRTLGAAVAEHRLPQPDALCLDVQGAEYQILSAIASDILSSVSLIYTEASTEEVYAGARTLKDISELVQQDFQLMGFAPPGSRGSRHGHALLVRRGLVRDAVLARSSPGARS